MFTCNLYLSLKNPFHTFFHILYLFPFLYAGWCQESQINTLVCTSVDVSVKPFFGKIKRYQVVLCFDFLRDKGKISA